MAAGWAGGMAQAGGGGPGFCNPTRLRSVLLHEAPIKERGKPAGLVQSHAGGGGAAQQQQQRLYARRGAERRRPTAGWPQRRTRSGRRVRFAPGCSGTFCTEGPTSSTRCGARTWASICTARCAAQVGPWEWEGPWGPLKGPTHSTASRRGQSGGQRNGSGSKERNQTRTRMNEFISNFVQSE